MPVECSLQEKETIPEKVAVLHSYPSQDVGNNAICKGDNEIWDKENEFMNLRSIQQMAVML